MFTESQKKQMKRNGTPDATRDDSAAQAMKAELDVLIAKMEADAKAQLERVQDYAAVLSELGAES